MAHRSAPLLVLLALAFAPNARAAAKLTLDKSPVVLGRSESVGVTLEVPEPPGTEDMPLRLSVNVGSFTEPQRVAPGLYKTVYIAPTTRFPQVALVAVWRETGPTAPIDFLRIPLYGVTTLPVRTRARAEVTVKVGDEVVGTGKANGFGQAQVPIAVPPGKNEAEVLVANKLGQVTSQRLPISVPPYNRLTAALVPHAVLADGQSEARLEVRYDEGGPDLSPNKVKVAPTAGAVTFLRAEQGLYVYRYIPPAGTTTKEIAFDVAIDGDATAKAHTALSIGLPPPTRVVLRPPANPLPADGHSSAPLSVFVFDAQGMGLAAQDVKVETDGVALKGAARYQGGGRYTLDYVAPSHFPAGGLVQFTAKVGNYAGAPVTANYQVTPTAVPKELVARLVPDPVPADGRTEATLELDVRDSAGMPLRGARLLLAASDGTVSPATEEDTGHYKATYRAPQEVPPAAVAIRVIDEAGQFGQTINVPMREDPHRLMLGVRGGVTHNLGDFTSARAGVDVWSLMRVGGSYFALGLSAMGGQASKTVADSSGLISTRSTVQFVPLALRLGYEVYAGKRSSIVVGAGPSATYASYKTTLTSEQDRAWGFGGFGFFDAGVLLGPGQAFAELNAGVLQAETDRFRLDAGGVGLEAGYRVGLF